MVALAACSGSSTGAASTTAPSVGSSTAPADASPEVGARLDAIDAEITAWEAASDLAAAHASAEAARNLVVGPAGPYYGDANGDGTVAAETEQGLLPGLGGEPAIATEQLGTCVVRDVLGGSWVEPHARWAELDATIDAWTPTNNTFPTLPSHPQRIVGWATLTLRATTVEQASEYAGHARLHIEIAQRAVSACDE